MQRSWLVLFLCCLLLLPLYVLATPCLKLLGQADHVAEQAGLVALWSIPIHFNFAFVFPVQMFLQSQLRAAVLAWVSLAVLVIHVGLSWVFVHWLEFGVVGAVATLGVAWWLMFFGLYGYTLLGGCPDTWTGFSMEAFSGLWEFVKLSAASGVMLCLEIWYYRVMILMTANLKNATIAVDALAICTGISGLEMMIPIAFLSGTGVRVGNELGSGNVKAAKFATIVSLVQSTIIGLFFCTLIMVFHYQIALIFTSSADVLEAVDNLSLLLAISILLNSIQPVLSGVAVGSGWQAKVAFVNLGCYYVVGVPLWSSFGLAFEFGIVHDVDAVELDAVGPQDGRLGRFEEVLDLVAADVHRQHLVRCSAISFSSGRGSSLSKWERKVKGKERRDST
ncbi:hypothetical protein RHMOL_Rhmol06G0095500 [Rhododendron molle]|uniref:Uncharacterized protein n=1 Tax=Rhododendron molle TaxID=49168 RepID=A0ACC0NCU6_RHOML|nr:hypothetical protein RHMOL_Rhmol06G0095500 [Rhododendron molle]